MKFCNNCGKTNCDCNKYEEEIQSLVSQDVPMSFEEKKRMAGETVRRWKEKETAQNVTDDTDKGETDHPLASK